MVPLRNIRHVWLFITDRCNLDCDYCFFQNKTLMQDLGWGPLETLLSHLDAGQKHEFVISGGEPLLRWFFFVRLVKRIRASHPLASIVLQSNMTLLTPAKINFLKSCRIGIEPGIDGRVLTNKKHRKNTTARLYETVTANIVQAVRQGLDVFPTMTVHPAETSLMRENFQHICRLGVSRVDLHPAFLAAWSRKSAATFIRHYRSLAAGSRLRTTKICPCYSRPMMFGHDLVVLPTGDILPNWTFLAFPRRIRDAFIIMTLRRDGIRVHARQYGDLLRSYKALFKNRDVSYREFSNHNAALAMRLLNNRGLHEYFHHYQSLCAAIKTVDAIFLKRSDGQRAVAGITCPDPGCPCPPEAAGTKEKDGNIPIKGPT